MFVAESPNLYASWANSGDIPILYSIGKKIGASKTYLLVIDPINRLIKLTNMINVTIKGIPVKPILARNFPPSAAIIVPSWLYENHDIKIDEKKHSTIKAPKPSRALNSKLIKSLSFFIFPAPIP